MRDIFSIINQGAEKPYKREERKDMSFDHVNYQKGKIWDYLDLIEKKTGKMAHEDEYCHRQLKDWQDGKLANSTFINHLSGYIDQLNSGVNNG